LAQKLDASIVIVGAGPAGATAAYFLARVGIDVLLVDRAKFPRDKSCGDSICPGAVTILDKMGLLDEIEARGYVQNRAYFLSSPSGHMAHIPFPRDLANYPNYLIPRKEFDNMLVQHAIAAGAEFRDEIRIVDMERIGPQHVRLVGRQGGRDVHLDTMLVIAADGSISAFTRKLGLVPGPADAVALRRYYADVEGEPGTLELHWEKSVLPAYGFIFHLNDGIANVGTGMFQADLRRLKANLNERLETFVTQNVHAQKSLGSARPISPVVGHPYRDDAERVTPYMDNVLVVGDAAGAGHPMTGEGIGPAMLSAELAAAYAAHALVRGDVSMRTLAMYGNAFHGEFDALHRISLMARRALSVPLLVDRTVKRCSHDEIFARSLAGILAGVVSPRAMLHTGMLMRVAMG
jgi:geranylgeranyl reductase family protein